MKEKIHPRVLEAARKVTAKRPRTVIEHILKHGFVTTQDLERKYGYNHPPRAARDVREAGIPLETFKVTGRDGRRIAAYRFGDPDKIEQHKLAGRRVFSKDFKRGLFAASRGRCQICQTSYEARYLQIDHRIPYEVAGDDAARDQDPLEFMLLCGSCQRVKSWTCEHCENWITRKEREQCAVCYWSGTEDYTHVALRDVRRLELWWLGEETALYETLRDRARQEGQPLADLAKKLLRSGLVKSK